MVHDVVDQYLHAQAVSVGDQSLIFRQGTHVIVEGVEIDDVVAVIVGVSIFPDGSEPQSGDAEIVQI